MPSTIESTLPNGGPNIRLTLKTCLSLNTKGKRRLKKPKAAENPILTVPIEANPILADLMECYCAKFYNIPPPTAIWGFAPYENSSNWQAPTTLSAWLLEAYTAFVAAPPLRGFKWTSHSFEKGAASGASCIGVPLHVVKYMGGWAENNALTLSKGYTEVPSPGIEPAPPCPESYAVTKYRA
jgi:hypothetical protein